MEKQVTSTPQYLEMGGSGYLYLHYWPPVDREPAMNVDMVNMRCHKRELNIMSCHIYFIK